MQDQGYLANTLANDYLTHRCPTGGPWEVNLWPVGSHPIFTPPTLIDCAVAGVSGVGQYGGMELREPTTYLPAW